MFVSKVGEPFGGTAGSAVPAANVLDEKLNLTINAGQVTVGGVLPVRSCEYPLVEVLPRLAGIKVPLGVVALTT
jgi:hypothetical protein